MAERGPRALDSNQAASPGLVANDVALEDATPVADANSTIEDNADEQMQRLVSEVLRLAPIVSPGILRSAAMQLVRALHSPGGPSASEEEDSPLHPLRLPFTHQGERDGSSDGSVSSRAMSSHGGSVIGSDDDVPIGAPIFAAGAGPIFRANEYVIQAPPPGEFDDGPDAAGPWPPPPPVPPPSPPPDDGVPDEADVGSEADSAADAAGGSEGAPRRRRRRGGRGRRGRGGGRDALGLAHGRTMLCDVCDDQSSDAPQYACMAEDMLQQSRLRDIVAKHQRRLATPQGRAKDPDRREARYALYRGFVAWQWADPLGSENRVRLPKCVMTRIRRLFPNPICQPGVCDHWVECERRGHYTGFRTAEESRAVREGQFVGVDVR